ncbi:MAG: GAF domain-containing sensor histidine kinase [Anaerolineales bacterium]|jgi:signal transduction histidine kinase
MSAISRDFVDVGQRDSSPDRLNVAPQALRLQKLKLMHEVERLRAMLRMSAQLSASLNYDEVLELALDLGGAVLSETSEVDDVLVRALLLFSGEDLEIASARGLTRADLQIRLAGRDGVLARSLNKAKIVVCDNPSQDPELRQLVSMQRCGSAVCIPLSMDMNIYGLMVYAHPAMDFFQAEEIELLSAVASQAMIALQNAQLFDDLAREKERMAEALEEARKKLARDLHDGPTQSVGAITMRVNFARRLLGRDPKAASDELFRVEELARRTCKEMRQMLFTLRPLVLESNGLIAALEHLAKQAQENYGQSVIVQAKPDAADLLELGKQNVLFYVADEAINNSRKHARAAHVWVRAYNRDDIFVLEIEDDGVGFDVKALEDGYEERGSLGMVNMHERAEIVNGVLKIDSGNGRGTVVGLAVPLTPDAAERVRRPGFSF